MPDAQIHPTGTVPTPADYVVPDSAELLLKGVYAKFDGSGAAGSYQPLVRIISDAGSTVIEAVSDTTIAAGASADASWFPHLAAAAPAVAAASLPCCFFDTNTSFTLNPWGGFSTPVDWGLFTTNDPSVFSWPSGGVNSLVNIAKGGVYRYVYEYRVTGTAFPAGPGTILSQVGVSVTGATSQQLSVNSTTAALYRGDQTTGFPAGPTGERVFNTQFPTDARLLVAWQAASGTATIISAVGFIYRIGDKVF